MPSQSHPHACSIHHSSVHLEYPEGKLCCTTIEEQIERRDVDVGLEFTRSFYPEVHIPLARDDGLYREHVCEKTCFAFFFGVNEVLHLGQFAHSSLEKFCDVVEAFLVEVVGRFLASVTIVCGFPPEILKIGPHFDLLRFSILTFVVFCCCKYNKQNVNKWWTKKQNNQRKYSRIRLGTTYSCQTSPLMCTMCLDTIFLLASSNQFSRPTGVVCLS